MNASNEAAPGAQVTVKGGSLTLRGIVLETTPDGRVRVGLIPPGLKNLWTSVKTLHLDDLTIERLPPAGLSEDAGRLWGEEEGGFRFRDVKHVMNVTGWPKARAEQALTERRKREWA